MSKLSRLLGIVTKKELEQQEREFDAYTRGFAEAYKNTINEMKDKTQAHENRLNAYEEAVLQLQSEVLTNKNLFHSDYGVLRDKITDLVNLHTIYKNEHLEKHQVLIEGLREDETIRSNILGSLDSMSKELDREIDNRTKSISRCNERIDKIHKDSQNRRKVKS